MPAAPLSMGVPPSEQDEDDASCPYFGDGDLLVGTLVPKTIGFRRKQSGCLPWWGLLENQKRKPGGKSCVQKPLPGQVGEKK